jgi:predicted TIM-barrel fold metal-dependent hydrolase
MLSTSYDGHYPGHPEFDPLMAELDRRQAVVFVHPATPLGMDNRLLEFPASLMEYTFDTTRCIVNMLHHDYPKRFANIKFIFSHGGGAAPYLHNRLGLMEYFLQTGEFRKSAGRALRYFYYDVALACSDPILEFLGHVVGFDRVVFGSDYPQAPQQMIQTSINTLSQSSVISDDARKSIASENARRLFPRLGKSGVVS